MLLFKIIAIDLIAGLVAIQRLLERNSRAHCVSHDFIFTSIFAQNAATD
jgi:hypothetical protein